VKEFFRFERLTTELLVRWLFVVFAVGLVLLDGFHLARRLWPIALGGLCAVGMGLAFLVVKLMVLRISCEVTLLAYTALRKYCKR